MCSYGDLPSIYHLIILKSLRSSFYDSIQEHIKEEKYSMRLIPAPDYRYR
jgi:hypothetical protein